MLPMRCRECGAYFNIKSYWANPVPKCPRCGTYDVRMDLEQAKQYEDFKAMREER